MCKSCISGLHRTLFSTECPCDYGYQENASSGLCEKIIQSDNWEISFYNQLHCKYGYLQDDTDPNNPTCVPVAEKNCLKGRGKYCVECQQGYYLTEAFTCTNEVQPLLEKTRIFVAD
eukprot:TRINITY_DN7776_c0_g2_i2.p4 TRINITY_DN7776_c0_g2~~TRINITY_DN7776_c0_g2_i2.p4  ORF type:complete len:117 (-),score=14.36 TRINITY_DN7776_c0_g2_i2:418-768(-)